MNRYIVHVITRRAPGAPERAVVKSVSADSADEAAAKAFDYARAWGTPLRVLLVEPVDGGPAL